MTIQTPTRIVIEIHPSPTPDAGAPVAQPVVTVSQHEEVAAPATYESGPCTCLDGDDCAADHGND
jgi:hypothetical protein